MLVGWLVGRPLDEGYSDTRFTRAQTCPASSRITRFLFFYQLEAPASYYTTVYTFLAFTQRVKVSAKHYQVTDIRAYF